MSDFTTGVASFEVARNGKYTLGRITVFSSGEVVLAQEDLEDPLKINTVLFDKQAVEAFLYMVHATETVYRPTPPEKLPPNVLSYKRVSQALVNMYKRLRG